MSKDARVASRRGVFRSTAAWCERRRRFSSLLVAAIAAFVPTVSPGLERAIYLLSQTARGQAAEGRSEGPAVNQDGASAAYNSDALNLVSPPFQNHRPQVYARDLDQTTSELVSQSPSGEAGNRPSQTGGFGPGISADGRYVAFSSRATNLVAEPIGEFDNVFVYDRQSNTMELISRGLDGPADGPSSFPRLSADGRFVVFQSSAGNLVEAEDGELSDIFLFDRVSRVMRLVSVSSTGEPANNLSITPAISGDGRIVAFASRATNLVATQLSGTFEQIFAHDTLSGETVLVSVNDAGTPANKISFLPALTAVGAVVAFKSEAFNLVPGDTNGWPDVFVRNRALGTTQRVSVDDFGNEANGLSGGPGISGDGRFVGFVSFASNLVPDDGNGFSDVYVYDRFPPGRAQGRIARVSVAFDNDGEPNQGVADFPVSVSRDGRWIAFASAASNLVPDDFNNDVDAFLACNPFDELQCVLSPVTPTPTATPTVDGDRPCVGDCNGDGRVTIDDLIKMVNIALGLQNVCGGEDGMGQCLAGDANCDCEITVDEIILAVNNNLHGCMTFGLCTLEAHAELCCGGPLPTPTATATPPVPTTTPTPPPGPCVGDCDGNGEVTVADLVRMVSIALDQQPLCGPNGCLAGDANCDCEITVDDIVRGVNNNLRGCTDFGSCTLPQHEAMCCAG